MTQNDVDSSTLALFKKSWRKLEIQRHIVLDPPSDSEAMESRPLRTSAHAILHPMSPHTLEIFTIRPDKISVVTSSSISPIANTFRTVAGVKCGYFGVQSKLQDYDTEDLFMVQVWESVDKRNMFLQDEQAWNTIQMALDAMSSQFDKYSVSFDMDPTAVLTGPCTEIARLIAKEGISREQVLPLVSSLLNIVSTIPGVTGSVFGPVLEDERSIAIVQSWLSVDHFKQSTGGFDAIQKKIAQIKEIADIDLKLTTLAVYQK